MKSKKNLLMVIIALLMLLTTACNQNSKSDVLTDKNSAEVTESTIEELKEGPELNLTLGHASPEGISIDLSVKEAAKELSDSTNEKMDITIFPAGQLGGDREQIEATQFGDQDIWKGASSALVSFVPEFAIFDMPMAFLGYSHEEIKSVLNGEVGDFKEKLEDKCRAAGFELLKINSNNMFRTMSSNIPLHSITDFSGIRIRTMENKYHINFWENVGASPTPINFSELYIALQQGVVDAQENPVVGLVGSGQYEQQKFITDTDHLLTISVLLMNKSKFDSLTSSQQEMLQIFADRGAELEYIYGQDEYSKMAKIATDSGIEFIELDGDTKEYLKEKAQATVDLVAKDVGKDLVDSLFNSLEEIKGK